MTAVACAFRWRIPAPILTGSWRGPCGTIDQLQRFPNTPIATIVTPPASGGGGVSVQAVVDVDVLRGQPLTLDRSTGHLKLADPSYKPTAFVAGFAAAATASGFVATADQGLVELADWTPIAGTASLVPGAPYFLSAPGRISTAAPGFPDCIAVVGVAFSTTVLDVNPGVPVQL